MSNLDKFFEEVEEQSIACVDEATFLAPDADRLAVLLVNLRRAKRLLDYAAVYVEDELVKCIPHKTILVDEVGEITQHTGASRKHWDRDAVVTALAHGIAETVPPLVDTSTGEQVDHIELVQSIPRCFIESATPSWKVTGLRAWNINPDDYCEVEWGRKSIESPVMDKFVRLEVTPPLEGME